MKDIIFIDSKRRGILAFLFLLFMTVFFSSSAFAQINLEDGLVVYYPFNGNANDESGNMNDGTVIGAGLTIDRFGNANGAYYFDGNDSRINTGNGIKPSFPFTFSTWINPDFSNTEYAVVFQSDNRSSRYYGFAIQCNDDGNISGHFGNGGIPAPYSRFSKKTTTSPINENQWNHVLLMFDVSKEIRIFVNGIEQDLETGSGTTSTMAHSGADGHLGCAFSNNGSWAGDFVGIIDEMRVYNRHLTEEEIEILTQENPVTEAFNPVPPTGLPYNIVLTEVLLNDSLVPIGTQIGVFDGELCVGTVFYEGNPNQNLVAWQADPSQNLEGFIPGNTISFKYHTFWYSEVKNFDATANFIRGNGTFGDGAYSVVMLSASTNLEPKVALSNEVINFNALVVNESSSFPLLISNTGTAILHVNSFTNEDSHFSFSNSPMFLAPLAEDTLWVTFVPTEVIAYSDVLQITCDDPETSLIEIPMHGIGLPQSTPQLSVSPSALLFGGIPMNTTKTLNMNILNEGNGILQVTGITSSNAAFSIFGSNSFSLEQGQNQNVAVVFSPDASGVFSGNITIQTNDGNKIITASGVASQGHFTSVDPTGLAYTIIVEDVDVDGFGLEAADEVAVFDDTLCVGIGNLLNCKSVSFDGSGDYIKATQTTYPQMTMEAWAKIDPSETNGEIAGYTHTNADQNYGFSFRIVGDYLHAKAATNSDAYFYNNISTNISDLKGEWAHFAMTWENLQGTTSEVKLFVNGILVDSDIHTFPTSPYDPTVPYPYPFSMGGCYSNSQTRMFTGMVDEVRVWNIARDGFEIQTDMNRSLNGNEQGLVGYWNFDDNTANDLTNFKNHGTMYGNAAIVNDCQISSIYITAWEAEPMLSLPGFTSGNPMNFKVFTEIYDNWVEVDATTEYSIGNGNFGYAQFSVLSLEGTSGLEPDIEVEVENLYVAQLTLGETASKAFPIKNTGNAPLHISVSETSDVFSSSLSQAIIEAGDSIMCEITFTPNQVGGFTGELLIESNDPNETTITISLEGFALPSGAADISTSVDQISFGNVEINTEKTLSFFVINSGTTALTVSDIISENPTYSVSPNTFTLQNTNNLMEVFVTFQAPAKGIFSSELTINSNAAQQHVNLIGVGIENHFNRVAETGLPYYIVVEQTNLDDYIVAGDELAVFDGELCVGEAELNLDANNQSASFDGSGDYLQANNAVIPIMGDFTVSVWAKTASTSLQEILSQNAGSGEDFYIGQHNGNIRAGDNWQNTGFPYPADNEWHYFTIVKTEVNTFLYLDGVLVSEKGSAIGNPAGSEFRVGRQYAGNAEYFNGLIDEICVWNYALDVEGVNMSMNSKHLGDEPGLTGYWPFEGDFQDHSLNINPTQRYGNATLASVAPILLNQTNFSILAWEADTDNGLPGFTTGNEMAFKLWTEFNGIPTQLSATPTYIVGNGNFGFGEFTVANLEFALAEISVEPDELFAALEEPDSTTKTITITNPGDENLEYYIDEYYFNGMFRAKYYSNPGSGSSPDFGYFVYETAVEMIDNNWGMNGPGNGVGNDDFQVKWTGGIYAETTGSYQFRSYTDDGLRLYIDGQLIIDHWYDMGATNFYATIELTKGVHGFEFQYYDNSYGATAYLYWTQPGQSEELVTASNMQWINISPLSGTLLPDESENITVDFNSNGLNDGLYEAVIALDNNTVSTPTFEIPVVMNVTGNPQIAASDSMLAFGNVVVNDTSSSHVELRNIGSKELIISEMFIPHHDSTGFEYEVPQQGFPLTLTPGEIYILNISFTPPASGIFMDSLFVLSNAENQDSLLVKLNGVGITPPEILLAQTMYNFTLACNNIYTDSIIVINSGQENLYFEIAGNVPWLSTNPSNDSVSGGDSLWLMVNITTLDLYAGNHEGALSVSSNDPDSPVVEVNYQLTVTGEPAILANDFVDLGIANVGETLVGELVVANNGCDTLRVTNANIESQHQVFFINNPAFDIPPGDALPLYISFVPETTFQYSGIINIFSNDANNPQFQVVISAEGVEPPNMAVSPLALSSQIQSGETTVQSFSVQNTGGEMLNFESEISANNSFMIYLDGQGDYINVVHNDVLNPTNGFTFETWLYLHNNTNEFIVGKENASKGNYRLFVNENHHFEFELNKFNTISSAAMAVKNQWIHLAASFDGESMKIYIDGVLDASKHFDAFEIQANTANLRIGRSYQYDFLNGKMDEIRMWNIARNQSEIQSTMNQPLLGDEPELVLYFPFSATGGNIINDASYYGNNGILYGNPSRQNSTIPFDDYLSLSNPNGVLFAGQSQNVNLEISSDGFLSRDYEREVLVNSNAVGNPSDTISLALSIQGTGVIAPNPTQLLFNETFVGLTDTLELLIENSGALAAGISEISFSSQAFYPINDVEKTFPFSHKNLMIVFEPALVQQYNETLTISLSDANVEQITVPLSALGLTPPVPIFLPESLDFGGVVVNLTETGSIELSNAGSSALEVYNMSISNSNVFAASISLPLTLELNQSAVLEVSFSPINYNVVQEEIRFTTNIGEITLPLSGVGTPPDHDLAVVDIISPMSDCGLSETEQLTIKIQNFGELDQSDFQLGFSLNDGATVSETFSGALASGNVVEFSFAQHLDLSNVGTYDLQVFTLLPNDENTVNDTLTEQIINFPSVGEFTMLSPADSSFGIIEPVSFTWNPVSDATSYDLFIWRTNQQKPGNPTVSGIGGTSYVYYDYLNKNYLYNWQLLARNQCSESESDVNLFSFNVFSDLLVSEIIIPDTGYSGEPVNISFTITNMGIGATGLIPWKDKVFISDQQIFDPTTAINVAQVSNLSSLSSGQSYTQTLNFDLPDYMGGPHYVFVQTDINNKIQETDESNNQLVTEEFIQIILPPYPDLAVSGVQSMKGSIVPGETLSIGWNIENVGDASAIGGWSQRISLVAGQQRYTLGHVQYNDTLDAGGVITQNSSFLVPEYPGMDGEVFIEVFLTPYPELVETPDGALNNMALSTESFTLEKVISISIPQQTISEDDAFPLQCVVYRSGSVADPLMVNISASEPTRISVPAFITIPAGQSGKTFNLTAINNEDIEGDFEVEILVQEDSYGTATSIITVIDDEAPSLFLSLSVDEANEGDQFELEITRDFINDQPLTVDLFTSDNQQIDLPGDLTIEANQASAILMVDVTDDNTPELTEDVIINASFPGFNPAMASITILDDDIPQVELTINPDSVSESGGPYAAWGTLTRSEAGDDPVTIVLSASVDGQLFFPTQVIIPAGLIEKQFMISVYNNGVLDGDREIELEAAIYLSSCGCGVPEESGGTSTSNITIIDDDGPALSLESDPNIVNEGISNAGKLVIKRNTLGGGAEVQINLSHDSPDEIELPTVAIIPEGEDEVEVPFNTLDDGIEDGEQIVSISVSAEGYSSGSCWLLVSDRNIPDFVISGFELSSNTVLVNETVDVSIEVKNVGFAPAPSGAKVNIIKSTNNVLDNSDVVLSSDFTSSMLAIGETLVLNKSLSLAGNVEDFYLFAIINKDEALTELVTINNASAAKPLSVLPDYTATANVEGEVFNGDSPITITGVAEMASKTPAINKPVDVYVMVSGVRRVFKLTSDANGEFSIDFIPINGEAGDYTVGACYPNQGLNEAQDSFVLLGAKRMATSYIIWELHQGETQQKIIEIKNLSSLPLNNVNVEILSLPPGCNVNFTPVPELQGNAYASINCSVNATEVSSGGLYEEVKLRLTSSEGTEYDFSAWFYCFANTGNLKLNPVTLNETMVKGQPNYVEFELTNNGLDETGLISIDLPEAYWLSMASPDTISSLQPGESATATLKLMPGDDLQLNNPITGSIALSGSNSNSVSLPFTFEPISVETGDLLVDVVDEYTYNTQAAPHLEGANVVISHPYTGQIIAQGVTDVNGHFLIEDIPEGYYTLKVQAAMHGAYQDYIFVDKGVENEELVFVAFQAITYSWNVVPTFIEDEYEIELVTEYETNVPVPIVIMDMPNELPQLEDGDFFPFILTLTNVGLITANEVEVIFPDDEEYMFTANVDIIDILPQQSIQIPVVMERRPPEEKSGIRAEQCIAITNTKYKFECGPNGQMRITSASSLFLGRQCFEMPEPGGTNAIFSWLQQIPAFSPNNNSGSNGQNQQDDPLNPLLPTWMTTNYFDVSNIISTTPYQSTHGGCDPCFAMVLNFALDKLGNKSPIGVIVSLLTRGLVDADCWIGAVSNKSWSSAGMCAAGKVGELQSDLSNIADIAICYMYGYQGDLMKGSGMKSISEAELIYNDMMIFLKAYDAIENWTIQQVGNEELIEKEFFGSFIESIAGFVDNELAIDPNSQNDIINAFDETDITEPELNDFFDYWNTTMQARDSGIYSPTPEYPDIIDTLQLHNNSLVLDTVMQYVYDRGYPSMDSLFKASITLFGSLIQESSTAVCASVTVQFSQTLTMTREAFEGTLSIFNGHETDAMENIQLNLEIWDEEGNFCNDLFQINTLSLGQITGIDGSGILDALETGTAVIQFIPEQGAAPEVPKYYSFGGTLSYLDPFNGEIVDQFLVPAVLQVNPSPDLYINYFLQRNVFGDDALTEEIEAMIPAELSVMVDNRGNGTAYSLTIESAQPQIIDNEKGLLVDFNITGSNLGGQPKQLGLLDVDFGDIPGGDIAVGQWWFTSSLLGHFVSSEVNVNHLDSWGNPDLSLISEVNSHELIKSISAYGAFNDSINDFLVNDIPDVEDIPDVIYYSNGIVAPVVLADDAVVDGLVTLNDTIVELTLTPSDLGWNYTKIDDPGDGLYRIVSVTRDDELEIPLDNIWLTYSTIPDGGEPIYEKKLHFADIFDENTPSTYTIVFEPIDQDVPKVLAINGIPEGPTDIPVENVEVVFSEAIDVDSFTFEDMTLKNQAGPNLMDTLVFISQVNDSTFNVDISDKTTLNGYYTLTVQAAGVADLVGNFGEDGMQVNWLQAVASPAIDYFFGLPEESGEPIDTLLVLFNMPINTETFTNSQLILEDGDGNVIPSESLVISSESFNDVLFKISGLANLASEDGLYNLTFKLTEIQGENGQVGSVNQFIEWTVCQIELPFANAGNDNSLCIGESYQLSGTVENAGSYQWSTAGDGTFDDSTSLSAIYIPGNADLDNGSVELSLTAEALNECAAPVTSTLTLTILESPVANAGDDALICENFSQPLFGTVLNANDFTWLSSGDGVFSNSKILTPSYTPGAQDAVNGMVEISLVAQPISPCSLADTSSVLITIQQAPMASAGGDTIVCEDQTLMLTAIAQNYSSLTWIATGDGTFSSQTILNPVYNFGNEDINGGSLNIYLIAQPVSPCFLPAFANLSVEVGRAPFAFAGDDDLVCENGQYMLNGAVFFVSSFLWSTSGDGEFSNTQDLNTTYTPGAEDIVNGSMQITLTGQAQNPCTVDEVSTMILSIQYPPEVNAGDDATICENQTHELSGIVANQSSFVWESQGDGTFDDEQILSPVYSPGYADIQAGTINVSLTAQPISPCALSDVSTITLEIQDLPQANAGEDATICENQTQELSGIVANQSSFVWESQGDGTFDDSQILSPIYYPGSADIQAGTVNVNLTAQPIGPCALSDVSTITLEIQALPIANAGEDATICKNQTQEFSGIVANQSSFVWESQGDGTFDDSQILSPVYYPGSADIQGGTVNVILTAQPISPCALSDVSTITLGIQDLPQANAGEDATICENENILLSGYVENSDIVFWSTGGDGTFENESATTTSYYPGEDDISSGEVQLILSALPISPCLNSADDEFILTLHHCLDLNLPEGWSGVSSYVEPLEPELETVFVNLADDLIILQSQSGVYWPGQNINTIGAWNTSEGYSIKMIANTTLAIIGSRSVSNSLLLETDWTMMPVLSECPADVADLFNGKDVSIVKEVAGWRVYWPEFGINTLGELQPGKAYFALMGSEEVIEFPDCSGSKSSSLVGTLTGFQTLSELMPWDLTNPTAISHNIAIPASANSLNVLAKGDIIGVFDINGKCYGLAEWSGANTGLTTFGNDPLTAEKDGFDDGETMVFKLFRMEDESELTLDVAFNYSMPQTDAFTENGLSAIKELKSGSTGFETTERVQQSQIVPNPAHDAFTLILDSSPQSEGLLELYNLKGQLMKQIVISSKSIKVEIEDLPVGVYIANISIDNQTMIKQLIKY